MSLSTLEGTTDPDAFPGDPPVTYALIAALVALVFVSMSVGFARLGFELGCRFQAAQRHPEIAHTASGFRPALAWARTQAAYTRRRSVMSLMFGR